MNSKFIKSVASKKGDLIVARIMPGTDLITGIGMICRSHAIDSGFIVSGIGSLRFATVIHVVADKTAAAGASYVSPRHVAGPLELTCLQGTIGVTYEGDISVHLHGVMTGSDMQVSGGHLVSSGNPVLATAEVMICPTPDVSLMRRLDKDIGFELFNPTRIDEL